MLCVRRGWPEPSGAAMEGASPLRSHDLRLPAAMSRRSVGLLSTKARHFFFTLRLFEVGAAFPK
jgi:hypothetical protein